MKRWLLFAFDDYYPSGGIDDLLSAHDTLEEAESAAVHVARSDFGHDQGFDNREIVDMRTLRVVRAWRAITTWETCTLGPGAGHLEGARCNLRRVTYREDGTRYDS